MFAFSAILLLLVPTAFAGMTQIDLNCTTETGATSTYIRIATSCSNKQDDVACSTLFGTLAPPAAVAPGQNVDRPPKCINSAADVTGPPDTLQTVAIASCAKHCGYCCLTPEYNCDNVARPRIPCNTITQEMCDSTAWRQIIAEDCPSACGFCLEGGCIDVAPNCALNGGSVCVTIGLESFVQTNCRRTCGLCTSTTTAGSVVTTATSGSVTTAGTGICADSGTNCANWVRNGFCNSTFYNQAQKRQFCGRSCGLC